MIHIPYPTSTISNSHRLLLQLSSISLVQFKNYAQSSYRFTNRIVGICGRNGMGKTNLLDAIHYLCFTKSYFSRNDSQHIHHGSSGFRIEAEFERENKKEIAICILRENGRKEFSINDEVYEKLAQHIGHFPCVIIAPDDVAIISGGSEGRRRYMDALISQIDSDYLQQLIEYNKVLLQRNSHLKWMAENRSKDFSLLEVYDKQMADYGKNIFDARRSRLKELIPLVKNFYHQIAGAPEELELVYESQLLNSSFEDLLQEFRLKDLMVQRTNAGIHKDDIYLELGKQSFRNLASQGQRKSLLFALKLAEFEILKKNKHFAPLLLLDDVFEKLDEQRMHNMLTWVCLQNEGQIFITDTHCSRINEQFKQLSIGFQLIQL